MIYPRAIIKNIEFWLEKHKIIILYGARQVGKSTILARLKETHSNMIILNAELPTIQELLSSKDIKRIKFYFGKAEIIAIDEAQKIENIGSILKILYDSDEIDCKIIATGSSSFELSNLLTEPLTGRNIKFAIYPFSLQELQQAKSTAWTLDNLNQLLVYGQYPELIDMPVGEKQLLLENLSLDYLFQDILKLDNHLNTTILRNLLRALAFQIGSQVSYNELAQLLQISSATVTKYVDLLEKCFVIVSISSLSKNIRNEIKKSKKFYFIDLGIRNAMISNFAPIALRTDAGALWENFCIIERIKLNSLRSNKPNIFFWRTYDQAEIDLIEEIDGYYNVFEFKWNRRGKYKIPESFLRNYDVKSQYIITPENIHDLLISS